MSRISSGLDHALVNFSRKPACVFLHEGLGSVSLWKDWPEKVCESLGCEGWVYSRRGYGQSEGSPSQEGLVMDAEAALDYLLLRRDVVDPEQVFLFGRSLGGAVAMELASRRESQIRGIIVENTFTSMQDLVKHLSPAFSKHMVRAMTNKWDTLSIIGNISKPMLLLSGRADEIVPPRMMTTLYKAAILSEGRELAAFPKGKHNSTCLSRGYYETIKRSLFQT